MFADIHCHPGFAPHISSPGSGSNLRWGVHQGVIKAQSSISQNKAGGTAIVVLTVYALERALANSWLVHGLAPRLTPIDKRLVENIRDGQIQQFDLMASELTYCIRELRQMSDVNIVGSRNGFINGKVNIVFAIEGAHSLIKQTSGGLNILANLDYLKRRQNMYPSLYITLTHFTNRNPLCVQADAVRIPKLGWRLPDYAFMPRSDMAGLSDIGKRFVESAYHSNGTHRRILIDIKHMSAYSRIDFYRFRANNNLNQYPIVASHVGIAGLSFSEIGKYSKWRRTVHRRSRIELVKVKYTHRRPAGRILLNPWTLNLYDEDIFEILKSRGLIGIMFDRGRLGQSKVFPEYLGTMEFKELSNNFQKFHDADEWEEFSEPEIEMNEYESSILDFTDEFSFEELGEQNYGEYEKIGDDEGQGYFGFLQESADASQSEFQDDATVKALNNINATAFAEIKLDQNLEFNYQAAKAEPAELSEISYYDDGETISAFGQKSVIQKSNVSAIEYFIGNILHVLRVSHSQFGSFEPGINSLCIGTDFDGLIGPLNGFNNATKFPVFRDQLSIYLRRYLHNWPATQIDRLVTNLSYANAERFIKNNLD